MRGPRAASVVLIGAAALLLVLSYRALRLLMELQEHQAGRPARIEAGLLAGALALAGGLLVAASRRKPELRLKLALAVASATLTLYLFEGWQAFDDPIARRLTAKRALIASLNRQGKDAYGGVEPSRFVSRREIPGPASVLIQGQARLPLAGISRRLTVDCQEGDEPWLVYVSDEHGFRNPPGLWAKAPVDLAAVGDSFTAGSCVDPARNLVGRLRQRYPSALNLGMPGSGPLIMLAELLEYGPLARPRVVLWCHFSGNDMRDLRLERGHPILERYLEAGFRQGLAEHQPALDAALQQYHDSWLAKREAELADGGVRFSDWLVLRATRSRLGLAFPDPATFAPTPAEFQLFERILATASGSVSGWNGRLYFAYLPAGPGTRPTGARAVAGLEAATRDRVLSIAARLGLPVVDLAAAFAEHGDPDSLFACPGCHYSVAGYALVALRLLGALEPASPPTAGGEPPQTR